MSAVPSAEISFETTIAELFSLQVARTPDAIALICGDCRLSYRQIDQRSNGLARHLRSHGVFPGTLVGLAMERSESLVISLLAILKAGGAYVPLDIFHPRERLSLIIEDAALPVLLTTSEVCGRMASAAQGTAVLDVNDSAVDFGNSEPFASGAIGSDAAYVIYTSGSTGRPKGVMVENRNVVSFFAGMDSAIGRGPGVWLAVTSVSFDISVLELLWTMTRGFSVVVNRNQNSGAIADEITQHGITHLQMTPSLARMLMLDSRAFAALGSLRQILLGGETVPASVVRRLRQVFTGEIYNMYGPTETTIWSTSHRVDEVGSTIPIGKPIAGTQVYLLDAELNPVQPGEVGELFIAGNGVARGYWNRPDLTAERFLTLPHLSLQRIYRTGDLARRLPDNSLEFIGRVDYQIKLRGYRIEPGEIEAALEQCLGIREAVVVMREDRFGDARLIAYVVGTDGAEASANVLRERLAQKLPDYMIPSSFTFLSALPLTANGKIDRKALLSLLPPDPVTRNRASISTPQERASVMCDADRRQARIEVTLAGWWQELLGLDNVGLADDFFALGGHSLVAARLFARIRKTWHRDLELAVLFQARTVRELAELIRDSQDADSRAPRPASSVLVSIQPKGSRVPFFGVHHGGGDVLFYDPLAKALGPDQPFYAFRSPLVSQPVVKETSIDAMAALYVRQMRSLFPQGPYLLGGLSFGGLVAFAMAQQLAAQGVMPALVVLFDTSVPGSEQRADIRDQISAHWRNIRKDGAAYVAQRMIQTGTDWQTWLLRRVHDAAALSYRLAGCDLPQELRYSEAQKMHWRALTRFQFQPYAGRIALMRAMNRGLESPAIREDPALGWERFAAGGLEIHDVPGDHESMLSELHVRAVAEKIEAMISKAVTESH
jgi:amino acid adenylation domain-containing protein